MCGISFILDKRGTSDDQAIQRMLHFQTHRGPDAQHYQQHNLPHGSRYFLAASRLRITENSENADQPFFNASKTSVLLFNGEIYNYPDLKNELLNHNVVFSSNADTEVLFHWIKIFGEDGIDVLEGMFAFVYCDFEAQKTIIARDRFGMKPLYYFDDDNFLIIASESRAIANCGLVKKELNEKQIAHYFNFKTANPPETFFKSIYQIRPGQYAVVKHSEMSKPSMFYNPAYDEHSPEVPNIKSQITDSLIQQVVSSRGIGLLLSGGIDSSLLLALAVREGISLPCYSIFTKENTEDKKNAHFIAKKNSVEHRVLEIGEEILEGFENYVDRLDQPIADSAGLLTYHISKFASEDIKVLMSGAGADELFAGYNRHRAFAFYLKRKKASLWFKKYGFPVSKRILPRNVNSYFEGVDKDEQITMTNFINSHFSYLGKHFPTTYQPNKNTVDPLKNLLIEDLNNYLPNDVLAISDVMSMSVGVEMRMPYLSNPILETINKTSARSLMEKGQKWILRYLLSEFVSEKFVKQKKYGFGLPLHKWLMSEKNNHLWKLFHTQNSYIFNFLEWGIVKELLVRHKDGKGNHTQELWSMLTLGYWLQKEFGK